MIFQSRYQSIILIYIFILLYCNNFIFASSSSSPNSNSNSNSNNNNNINNIEYDQINIENNNILKNRLYSDYISKDIEFRIENEYNNDNYNNNEENLGSEYVSLTLQNSTTSINITGGESTCNNCTEKDSVYYDNFACSDNNGNWNGGTFSFEDPIPYDNLIVVKKVAMVVNGNFAKASTYPILVTIGTNLISFFPPPSSNNSLCPNCVIPFTPNNFVSFSNGLPGYKYGQSNNITFELTSTDSNTTICLSNLQLILYYGAVNYKIIQLIPPYSSSSGNEVITVVGMNFFQSDDIICKFGNNSVSATYLNSTILTCTTPALAIHSKNNIVDFQVSEDGGASYSPSINFTYSLPVETTTAATGSSSTSVNEPSKRNNNYNQKLLIILTTIGGVSLIVSSVLFFYCLKRYKNGKFTPVGSRGETSPLLKNDYKTLFEIKPIDIEEIVIQNRIGRGSCAEVFTGTWRGITVAIKKAKLLNDDDEDFLNELAQEATIMSQLRHPNVCQFLGTCKNPPEILIVMEFMPMGSLYRILHDSNISLDWTRMKSISLDIAKGMNYLHCCDPIVIHRDLKSHNLLVDEHFRVKISDFGLSTRFKKHLDRSTTMTPVGTPAWSAPEVIRNQQYTEKADVYSFGIVLWECATRMDPYAGLPTFQVICAVGKEGLRPPTPKSAPPEFTRLIMDCWSENPSQRPSFQEIVKRLESIDTKGWGDIPFVKFNPLNNINILQHPQLQQQQQQQQQLQNINNNNIVNNNNNNNSSNISNPNIIIKNLVSSGKKHQ